MECQTVVGIKGIQITTEQNLLSKAQIDRCKEITTFNIATSSLGPNVRIVELNKIGYEEILSSATSNPNNYQIVWVREGRVTASIDLNRYELSAPALLLIHPKNTLVLSNCSSVLADVIQLSEAFSTHSSEVGNLMIKFCVFDNMNVKPISLSLEANKDFEILINEFRKVQNIRNAITDEIKGYLVRILILKIYQFKYSTRKCSPQPNVHRQRYFAFKALVEEKFRTHHDVSFYVSALNTTEKTLRNSTNYLVGRSPSTLIQERIILEARRLLHYSSKSVKEIALDLGFEDPSYFTRLFSKKLGKSPNSFRVEQNASI